MKRLVEFPTDDGGYIIVEVDDSIGSTAPGGTGSTLRSMRPGELIEKAQVTYEDAWSKIKPAAQSIVDKMHDLTHPPDEILVEFGIKLTAGVGAIIAATSTEAQFTLRLTWLRGDPEAEQVYPPEALPLPEPRQQPQELQQPAFQPPVPSPPRESTAGEQPPFR